MAIKYVQTQIQTVASNIQDTFTHMQNLLISQLEHSNHLNHELEEFKLGIIDLVKGKLSPLLVKPEYIVPTGNFTGYPDLASEKVSWFWPSISEYSRYLFIWKLFIY